MTTGSYIAIGEFMQGCEGMLGDRPKSAVLTTYRTNFNKGLKNEYYDEHQANIKVFDFLDVSKDGEPYTNVPYSTRISLARMSLANVPNIKVIRPTHMNGKQAIAYAKDLVNKGWEGAMLMKANEPYRIGKRVNDVVKLKYRKTADLECIGIELGEGKYEGLLGALTLQDSAGRVVNVGSGLTDIDRTKQPGDFIGTIVEIEYEQIMDTYIQPTFVCVRHDKRVSD
jgi:ATP-dependent DNA ligase